MKTASALTILCFAGLIVGCNTPAETVANTDPAIEKNTETPPEKTETPTEATPISAEHGSLGDGVDMALIPAAGGEPFVRPRRRMTIEQLDRAIRTATGGIGWEEGNANNPTNLFKKLGSTLGVPDYIQVVQADLSPGAMFQKFLSDAARSVCTKLSEKEVDLPAKDRVLMVYADPETTLESAPEGVDANLQMLLLRYHGYQAVAGDPALSPWRWLFQSVSHVTNSPVEGWRAVCVGLMTHPDFYSI